MSNTVYRKRGFVRGIGEGKWHDKENWNFSAHTIRQDDYNYNELGIQSVRSWGWFPDDDSLQTHYEHYGTTVIGTVNMAQTNASAMPDGTPCVENFFKENLIEETIEKLSYLTDFEKLDGLECILMGNEQSYLVQNENGDYTLAGFDAAAQNAFHEEWLPERFGSIEKFNRLCGTVYERFVDVDPLSNSYVKLEFWFFLRNGFENVFEKTVKALKEKNPGLRFGYAKFMGRRNPTADDAYLRFMDYGCQNLYWQWYRDSLRYSVRLDELIGSRWGRPCFLTEYGMQNMFHLRGQEEAARRFRQNLPAMYMRPQIQGLELFGYSGQFEAHNLRDPEWSWGITWPSRNKKISYYAIKELYNNFKMLDGIFNGDMHNAPILAITNQLIDELQTAICTTDKLCRALYANGVNVRFFPTDTAESFKDCSIDRMLLADADLMQTPDGSDDVGKGLCDYLTRSKDYRMMIIGDSLPKGHYGYKSDIIADSPEELEKRFDGRVKFCPINPLNPVDVWKKIAPFVHSDFVEGSIAVTNGAIDETYIRILDTAGFTGNFHWDREEKPQERNRQWDVQQSIVFANSHAYLFVINTSEKAIDTLCVTFGINNNVLQDWFPEVICSGSDIAVYNKEETDIPVWITEETIGIRLRTLVINSLDTYAVIDLGKFNLKDD